MRQDTLLRIIIAVFAIILIVLATFVYGNVARNKQKANTTNTAAVDDTQTTTSTDQASNQTSSQSTNTPTASTPSNQVSSNTTPTSGSSSQTTTIPQTGPNGAVIPMTILSVLGYMYIKSRKTA